MSARQNEERAKELFAAAVELPSGERETFLARACAGDAALLRDLRSMLAADAREGEDPLGESAAWTPARSFVELAGRAELGPGGDVDGYHLERELGEGGFGVVYLASQEVPVTRTVALKVLKPGMDSRAVLTRFETERRVLARMEHPNVARILDAGVTGAGRPYFVMEYFDGRPITDFAREQKLRLRQRLDLFLQACRAVQHAHNRGVIHRDLKPSNVLVGEVDGRPTVKVIDFGVAKAVDRSPLEASQQTADGGIVGTPAYMSPEQAGGSTDIDTRCDVYMLGALLYELLCGEPTFAVEDSSFHDLLRRIQEDDPRAPRSVLRRRGERAARVPRDLEHVATRCLEKDRERRYPTADALAADVQRFLDGRPVEAARPSAFYRMAKLVRRHRLAFASAVLVSLSAIAGCAGLGLGYIEASEAQEETLAAYEEVRREATRARRAEVEAREQRAAAEEVLRFLTEEVIDSVLPSNEPGRGRDVTLREVLAEASRRMELGSVAGAENGMSPAVEARIGAAIGVAYRGLGDLELGIRHTRRAFEVLEELEGFESQECLILASRLAEMLRTAGRVEEAARLFERLTEHPRELLDSDAAWALPTLQRMARLRMDEGRHREALELIEPALDRARELHGERSSEYLFAGTTAAIVRDRCGLGREAGVLFEQVYRLRQELQGPDAPEALTAGVNLGAFLIRRDRNAEALVLLEELLPQLRRVYGDHEFTAVALTDLGLALGELHRHDEALDRLLEAIELNEAIYGLEHAETLESESRYAEMLYESGEAEEAVAIQEVLVARAVELFGEVSPVALDQRSRLVYLRQSIESPAELWPELEDLVEVFERAYGPHDPATLLQRGRLAKMLGLAGHVDRAELEFLRCIELASERGDPLGPEVIYTKAELAWLYAKAGRHAQARALAREALEDGQLALVEGSELRSRLRLVLGVVLAEERPAEALVVLEELFESDRELAGDPRENARLAAERIAELHQDDGSGRLAALWKARAEALR